MIRLQRRHIITAGVILMALLGAWLLRANLTAQIDSYEQCSRQGYPIRESNPPTCSDGRHTYLGPYITPPPSVEPLTTQEFDLLVNGDSGGSYPRQFRVINNQAEWDRFWVKIHAGLSTMPPLLPVDFADHDVVALSEGPKMTGGYSLKVTGISSGQAGTTVHITESIPTIGCTVTQSVTNRYLIVRTNKLPEPVNFRTTTGNRRCTN